MPLRFSSDTKTHQSFEPLGQRLKEEREAQGRSLRQIADRTRIPLMHLEAIERGDSTKLPAPVFVKGFLRAYAIELGLGIEEVLREYKTLRPEPDDKVAVPITARTRVIPSSSFGWSLAVGALVVVLILVGVIWGGPLLTQTSWFQRGGETEPAPPAEDPATPLPEEGDYRPPGPVADTETNPVPMVKPVENLTTGPAGSAASPTGGTGTPGPAGTTPPTGTSGPAGLAPPAGTAPPAGSAVRTGLSSADQAAVDAARRAQPPQKGHELTLVFNKNSWVQVAVDDGELRHGLFKAGQSQSYRADKKFLVRLGNAAGVRVVFDGEDLGPLGGDNKAVSLTLPRPNP